MRLAWARVASMGVPAVFLALFLVVPLVAILRIAGATSELGAWERGRLGWSLELGVLTSALALVFGLPLAYLLGRHRFWGRRTLRALVTVPFVMPVVVISAGLMALLGPQGFVARALDVRFPFLGTTTALLVAHTIFNVPLVVRLVGDTWAHLDPRLEEAAATLGATPLTRFMRVTLPRLMPSLAASALLAFIFGFTAFGTVLLLGEPVKHATLEVATYHDGVRLFDLPAAATLALLQLGVTLAAALIYTRIVASAARTEGNVDEETALKPLGTGSRALVIFGFVIATLLLLPLVAVVIRAFDTPDGWSAAAFTRLFVGDARDAFAATPAAALWNSTRFALLTVCLALPLGALAAYAAATERHGAWLDALWMIPLGASAVTLGLGLLVTFPWGVHAAYPAWWPDMFRIGFEMDLRATATLLVLAHVLVAFPFVVRALVGPIRARDPALPEAARTLGATRLQRAARIHLPLLSPALLVAAVLAAAVSLGEFGATLVLLRPEYATLPAEMYRHLGTGRPDPWFFSTGMAMATILLALNIAAFLMLERLRPGRSGGF